MIGSLTVQFASIEVGCIECHVPTLIVASVKAFNGGVLAVKALCPKHCGEVIAELQKAARKETV